MNEEIRIRGAGFRGMRRALALAVASWALAAAAAEPPKLNLTLADCVGLALENNLDLRIEKIVRTVADGVMLTNGLGLGKPMDLSALANAAWFGLPNFAAPVFSGNAMLLIAPVIWAGR